MLDGFIGACPFCSSRRTRQLVGLPEEEGAGAGGGATDDEGEAGDNGGSGGKSTAAKPATTMGGDHAGYEYDDTAGNATSWSKMGSRCANGRPQSLQFLCRLAVYVKPIRIPPRPCLQPAHPVCTCSKYPPALSPPSPPMSARQHKTSRVLAQMRGQNCHRAVGARDWRVHG